MTRPASGGPDPVEACFISSGHSALMLECTVSVRSVRTDTIKGYEYVCTYFVHTATCRPTAKTSCSS